MPLKLKKNPARSAVAEGEKLAEAEKAGHKPTLEQLRKKHDLGTLERVRIEAVEFARLQITAKEAGNAANRQKTNIRNAVKAVMRQEKLEGDDKIIVGDEEFRFDVTHNEKVSVEKLFKYYKDKKITEEQFLQSIAVIKTEAEKAVGAHIVNNITTITDGKKADVRVSPAEEPSDDPIIVRAKQMRKGHSESLEPEPIPANAVPVRAGSLRLKRKLSR